MTPGPRVLLAFDAGVAAVIALVAAVRVPPVSVTQAVWVATLVLPLVLRRSRPVVVLPVVLVAGAGGLGTGVAGEAVVAAVAYALYPVGLVARSRWSFPVPVVVTAVLVGVGLATAAPAPPGAESFATTPVAVAGTVAVVLGGTWVLARTVRARRALVEQLAELRAGRAVAEERLRIARDVHDVVGHGLGLIATTASVARHLADTRPEQGPVALTTIERISREALGEVRDVLAGLRDGDGPGRAEIEDLVADARVGGVTVRVERLDLGAAPPGARESARRILQEALTNVRRHAVPPACRVSVGAELGLLTVTVHDGGVRESAPGRAGHGLAGMRERVALHGGTLEAAPVPGGGFRVAATLPHDPGGAVDDPGGRRG